MMSADIIVLASKPLPDATNTSEAHEVRVTGDYYLYVAGGGVITATLMWSCDENIFADLITVSAASITLINGLSSGMHVKVRTAVDPEATDSPVKNALCIQLRGA